MSQPARSLLRVVAFADPLVSKRLLQWFAQSLSRDVVSNFLMHLKRSGETQGIQMIPPPGLVPEVHTLPPDGAIGCSVQATSARGVARYQ